MSERQERERRSSVIGDWEVAFVWSGTESTADLVDVRFEIPVCQLDAFGLTGRSTCVDETGEITRGLR
jgi:hypothetical protein